MTEGAITTPLEAARALSDWWAFVGVETSGFEVPAPPPVQPKPAASEIAPASFASHTNAQKATAQAPLVSSARHVMAPNLALTKAAAIAQSATDIEGLKAGLAGFDGLSYVADSKNCVFADGATDGAIMLIGQSPSQADDQAGKPFMGKAGAFLDQMLASIGISRDKNLYLTHVVNWRTPGSRAPNREELAICRPLIMRHIGLKAPKCVIFAGAIAAQAVLASSDGINRLRQKSRTLSVIGADGTSHEIPAYCLFSPENLLARPQDKAMMWADLLTLKSALKELGHL